jgi:hypothetical protein
MFIVEIDPPFEIIEDVFIAEAFTVEAARVDILTVIKLAVASGLRVFIFPTRLRLLRVAVCVLMLFVVIPGACMMVEEYGAPLLVGHVIYPAAFRPIKFPVIFIVDAESVEGMGVGNVKPLIVETVSWGVDIQFDPVTNDVFIWLEAVTVLKLPERPNTC